jgi:Na+/melibiose symporter-like transporter
MLVASILVLIRPISTPPTQDTSDVSNSPQQQQHQQGQSTARASKFSRIDWIGTFLLSTGISSFILVIDMGGTPRLPWTSPITITLIAVVVITLAVFMIVESSPRPSPSSSIIRKLHAKEPIFPLSVLTKPNVSLSYGIMTFQIIAQCTMMYTLPLYFQVSRGSSTTVSGAHLVPAVVGNAIGGLCAGLLIKRTAQYKGLLVSAGLIACVTYVLLFLTWNGDDSVGPWKLVYELLAIIPGGVGTGIAQAAVFVAMTVYLDARDIGVATGGFFLCISLGILVGVTVCNTVLRSTFKRELERTIDNMDVSSRILFLSQTASWNYALV